MNIREIAKEARNQGWTVDETKTGHLRFTPPDGFVEIALER